MKKLSFLSSVAAIALASCSPQAFIMNIETRHPSPSGIEIAGKSMSVVYLDDNSGRDSVFVKGLAEGFAKAIEKEYFDGGEAVNIYRLEKERGGVYSAKDTLVNLVMDTGDDIIFLVDSPEFGELSLSRKQAVMNQTADSSALVYATIPFRLSMYVYDSMDKDDDVHVFTGTSSVKQGVFCSADTEEESLRDKVWDVIGPSGELAGKKSASSFLSEWKNEQFTILYYDSFAWEKAAQAAYEYRWHDAIDVWMSLLDTGNYDKRSCAEYNIATAFYLLGDYDLASKWLDRSDSDKVISLSAGLRARIDAKKK